MEQQFLYSFPKNEEEEVRFSIREYKDRRYLDLRIWFRTKEGEYRPTKKGLTLSLGLLGEVMRGIEKVSEAEGVAVEGGR